MIQNYSVSCSEKGDKRYLFQIKVNWLSIVTLFSVLVTFLFCVLWTVFFKLEEATGTHCGVRFFFVIFSKIFISRYALIMIIFVIFRLKITYQQYQQLWETIQYNDLFGLL